MLFAGVGGVVRARAIAKQNDDPDLAIIDKRRPQANETKVMNVIGNVEGKACILVGDIVDTAGTLCTAAQALKDEGAMMDEIVVTDTIPLPDEARQCDRITQLSLDRLLAESIRRVSNEESLSAMLR